MLYIKDKKIELLLISKVVNMPIHKVLSDNIKEKLTTKQINLFDKLAIRYIQGEPIEYILEQTEFYNLKLKINKNVLIPRLETEYLVELCLKRLKILEKKNLKIIDIATGSGNIAISLAKQLPYSQIYAIDISNKAIKLAKENMKLNSVNNIHIKQSSIHNYHSRIKYDLIISNPPYIPNSKIRTLPKSIKEYEPIIALDGGKDGMDIIREVLDFVMTNLEVNGISFIEINSKDQYLKLRKEYKSLKMELIKDQFKRNRYLLITK